jgi:hypothetical protein
MTHFQHPIKAWMSCFVISDNDLKFAEKHEFTTLAMNEGMMIMLIINMKMNQKAVAATGLPQSDCISKSGFPEKPIQE